MTLNLDLAQTPALIPDLIIAPDIDQPSKYVVKDVQTQRFFLFGKDVITVLDYLDGTHSIDEISRILHMPSASIQLIIEKLQHLNLLVSSDSEQSHPNNTKANWLRRVLFIRVGIFDSARFIELLYGYGFKYLFTPIGGILLLSFYVLALWIGLFYHQSIMTTMQLSAISVNWLPVIWIIFGLTALLHEFAHALACHHFGGRPGAIGIGLYYLAPVFFCEVNDAWFFSHKWHRLLTHGAGILCNLAVVASAVLIFALSENVLISQLMALIIVVNLIGTLYDLNPLWRVDGYFLLADFLSIKNLRAKGFNFLFISIQRLLYWVGILQNTPVHTHRNQREQTILMIYSGLATIYLMSVFMTSTRLLQVLLAPIFSQGSSILAVLLTTLFFGAMLWRGWHESRTTDSISPMTIA